MKRLSKIAIGSTSFLLISLYAVASQSPNPIYAAALNNCEIVKQITLTKEEADAWHNVEKLEDELNLVHEPLKAVETQLSEYGQEMDEISQLAVKETEQTLYIDKELMRQQEAIADKISALMEVHQEDFDLLGKLGDQIGQQADIFSDSIETAFDGLDYNRVTIFAAGESPDLGNCVTSSMM